MYRILVLLAALSITLVGCGGGPDVMEENNACYNACENGCGNACDNACDNACNACENACGDMNACAPSVDVNPCHEGLGTVYYIADPADRNYATFTSRAPLEDIVGTTNKISGYIVFDPENPNDGVTGSIKIPVSSINTGIPMRNDHMQGADWLDAGSNPNITFEVEGGRDVTLRKDKGWYKTYDMIVFGTLSIKGKSNPVEVKARVTQFDENSYTKKRMAGNLFSGRASFKVKLADYGVTGPEGKKIVGSKVGSSVSLEISFTASDAK